MEVTNLHIHKLYNTCILPIFLYCSECWIVTKREVHKIDALNQWCLVTSMLTRPQHVPTRKQRHQQSTFNTDVDNALLSITIISGSSSSSNSLSYLPLKFLARFNVSIYGQLANRVGRPLCQCQCQKHL